MRSTSPFAIINLHLHSYCRTNEWTLLRVNYTTIRSLFYSTPLSEQPMLHQNSVTLLTSPSLLLSFRNALEHLSLYNFPVNPRCVDNACGTGHRLLLSLSPPLVYNAFRCELIDSPQQWIVFFRSLHSFDCHPRGIFKPIKQYHTMLPACCLWWRMLYSTFYKSLTMIV